MNYKVYSDDGGRWTWPTKVNRIFIEAIIDPQDGYQLEIGFLHGTSYKIEEI